VKSGYASMRGAVVLKHYSFTSIVSAVQMETSELDIIGLVVILLSCYESWHIIERLGEWSGEIRAV
jgi:hypothetical protein